MNLESLKKKLQPKHHEFRIDDETIYIHRPTANDFGKCIDLASTLVVCVKDENGDPIFSTEDIDGRINVNMMDSIQLNKIHTAIMNLFTTEESVDEIEKK